MNSKIVFYYMRIFVAIAAFFFSQLTFSQGLKVKEFKQNLNDGSAFNAPMDDQGHPCGLIKVRTDVAELKFKGDVVGEVENKMNEYWVYMAQGSKQLGILHPNFLPMTIDFSLYGIDEVYSKATYVMILSEMKYNKEKCGVVMTVKPESATLYVDDVLVENISGNGYYQLYLPKGDHVCNVKQKGYRPYVQALTTGKGKQSLNVELESVMAELEIKCRTETAEIYVDGEMKGNSKWKGAVFAGEHRIEARQRNFEPYTQSISIAEKESRIFVIPLLKRAMGKLQIQTTPNNLPISIDSKSIGMSPCTIDIETGLHYIECAEFGLKSIRKDIDVSAGRQTITLKMEFENDEYREAWNGNMEVIKEIAENRILAYNLRGYESCAEEAVFWRERYSYPNELLDEFWIDAYRTVGKTEIIPELVKMQNNQVDVENDLKAFLDEYVIRTIDNIDSFLSEDYKEVVEKYREVAEWNLFGLASAEQVEKHTIISITEPVENRAAAKVKLLIDCEGSYKDYIVNIHLILEKDKWVVDEIGELKHNMKLFLIENGIE